MKNDKESTNKPLPPYIPFKTLLNFIMKLKEAKITPERIDRSILREYSGGAQRALIAALKFMSLISEDGMTSEKLGKLVTAYQTGQWTEEFGQTVKDVYSPIIGTLKVASATKAQLEEKFKAVGAEKDTLKKSIAFYIAAAISANIPLSPHITTSNRGKRDLSKKRVQKPKNEIPNRDEVDQVITPGIVQLTIPVTLGKQAVRVFIPDNLSEKEWNAVDQAVRINISLRPEKKEEPKK